MYKKLSKFIIISLVLMIAVSINVGCSRKTSLMEQTLSCNIYAEPETVDPALCTSVDSANVVLANFEGLMRLDKNNKAIPGVAASYTKNSDATYTFKLRDCKWSDGKAVIAKDFEYAWKRALAPETGSQYAYQLYYIKNGEAYNTKKTTADQVGIRVIDDKTIEVVLEAPTSYFLELLSFPTYMPVREDIVKANPDRWATNPASYIGNGAFKMSTWTQSASIELVKNNNYYDAARVKLDKLVFTMVGDANAYLNSWETGDIDIIESPPSSELSRLKNENKLTINPYLGTYFYAFNNMKKPLDDKRVRKALTYAIDRSMIISNVTKNEALPAIGFIPKGIPDAEITKDFRDVGGGFIKPEGQVEEAKKLLADAGYPGGKGFPTLTLSYNNTDEHKAVAQTIQDMWKKNLGINIKFQVQEWNALQKSRTSGDYEIARYGWIADYVDPMTFLDLFVTDGGNNAPKYRNKAYDDLIVSAKRESDTQKRAKFLHDAETILMEDMPILPIYFYTNIECIKPYVKGLIKSPLGFTYFDQAYVEEKSKD